MLLVTEIGDNNEYPVCPGRDQGASGRDGERQRPSEPSSRGFSVSPSFHSPPSRTPSTPLNPRHPYTSTSGSLRSSDGIRRVNLGRLGLEFGPRRTEHRVRVTGTEGVRERGPYPQSVPSRLVSLVENVSGFPSPSVRDHQSPLQTSNEEDRTTGGQPLSNLTVPDVSRLGTSTPRVRYRSSHFRSTTVTRGGKNPKRSPSPLDTGTRT